MLPVVRITNDKFTSFFTFLDDKYKYILILTTERMFEMKKHTNM